RNDHLGGAVHVNRSPVKERYRKRERILRRYIHRIPWRFPARPCHRDGGLTRIDARVVNASYVGLNLRAADIRAVRHAVAGVASRPSHDGIATADARSV